ncbi:flagellin [Clostridium sp. BNL1100]|uniref:flagellin N-terminal helical domain-containing protein n=1 Tax=Clostridium sp. BNL1100 TaxID=755731 RepID=UPI00024A7FD4|nr:flagellin [Clostridium sp. BNL1100]AEY68084.1 flagellin/flagellar hook associated protein [Clostridium sp. BNL1100]
MVISHNMSSLNSYNAYNSLNIEKSKSVKKLVSGLRINNASDDSAGLAISEKMRSKIRGLDQAQRNIQDGISLIQTVDGALSSIGNSLIRMKELAIKASNGVLSYSDRQSVQEEITQLYLGIEDIADNTEFNKIKLLDGSNVKNTPGTEEFIEVQTALSDPNMRLAAIIFDYTRNLSQSLAVGIVNFPTNFNSPYNAMFTFENPPSNPNFIYSPLGEDTNSTIENMIKTVEDLKNDTSGDPIKTAQKKFLIDNNISLTRYGIDVLVMKHSTNTNFTYQAGGPDGSGVSNGTTWVEKGWTADFVYHELKTTPPSSSGTPVILQVGPDMGDIFKIELPNAEPENLGLKGTDVTNQYNAQAAVSKIDKAMSTILSQRSKFGAYNNALEYTFSNVLNSGLNLTSAESRIRDTDMALEYSKYIKYSILQESAQMLLKQANHSKEGVLYLLNF